MIFSTEKIVNSLRAKIKKQGNPAFARSRGKFIGEKSISYGVKLQDLRRIVKEFYAGNPALANGKNCSEVAEDLFKSRVFDLQLAGVFLAGNCKIKDIGIIEKWFDYINDWAVCDTLSTEVITDILVGDHTAINRIFSWSKSPNQWIRRVALVTTVKLKDKITNWESLAEKILILFDQEKEPIVKKAVEWLKKELK